MGSSATLKKGTRWPTLLVWCVDSFSLGIRRIWGNHGPRHKVYFEILHPHALRKPISEVYSSLPLFGLTWSAIRRLWSPWWHESYCEIDEELWDRPWITKKVSSSRPPSFPKVIWLPFCDRDLKGDIFCIRGDR